MTSKPLSWPLSRHCSSQVLKTISKVNQSGGTKGTFLCLSVFSRQARGRGPGLQLCFQRHLDTDASRPLSGPACPHQSMSAKGSSRNLPSFSSSTYCLRCSREEPLAQAGALGLHVCAPGPSSLRLRPFRPPRQPSMQGVCRPGTPIFWTSSSMDPVRGQVSRCLPQVHGGTAP